MAYLTKLPLQKTITVSESRDTWILYTQIKDLEGEPIDFSGATVTGVVKDSKGRSGTPLGSLVFDNTLATGWVKASLSDTLADTLLDTYANGEKVYTDVKIVFNDWDQSLAEAEITLCEVVTP